MFRKTVWRNIVSDTVSFHQDQALDTTIFLLKAYGPTGFLLKEEGELKKFKVCLGDPHTCTCPVFHREREPCKHICWVLMRKFRLPREHEYCFQQGLVERQILEVLHGLHQTRTSQTENSPCSPPSHPGLGQEDESVCRKVIQTQDVCPICQEELLEKQLPVSYCRFGCGNNIHISCMKVWADHQALTDREHTVKCPLCREDFSSLKLLQEQEKNAGKLYTAAERQKPNRHLGILCHSCRVCPVTGKCFKCTICNYYYLCEDCSKKGCHPQHPFASRTKRREKWHHVGDGLTGEPKGVTSQPANDSIVPVAEDPLPEHVLGCLPAIRVRPGSRLLDPGQQCRICLHSFALGQIIRTLPCHHRFHTDCVDGILRKSNSCPLDGYVIYNPLTWSTSERKTTPNLACCLSNDPAKLSDDNIKDLFIPGVPLLDKTAKATPSPSALSLEVLTGPLVPPSVPQNLMTNSLQGLCLETVDTVAKEGKGELQKDQTFDKTVFPKRSSYFDRLSKYDRQSSHTQSLKKRLARRSATSPRRLAAVASVREQAHENLFVGSRRTEPDLTATVAFPTWRTKLQPKPRLVVTRQDTSNRHTSELRMIGSLINIQHQRKKS